MEGGAYLKGGANSRIYGMVLIKKIGPLTLYG